MKKNIKKLFALCLILALGIPTNVNAMSYTVAEEVNEVTPRAMYTWTFTDTVSHGNNKVKVTASGTVRDETANTSGLYITGFTSLKISNAGGWQSVSSSGQIVSISYSNNHQKATVVFNYKASVGAGLESYQGTATFEL